jgi:magnesium chelatase family protein
LKYRVPHDSVSFNIQISEGTKIHCNAQMTQRFIKKYCELDAAGNRMLEMVTDRLGFPATPTTASVKVARTIADLDGSENIHEQHIAEAIQYRSLNRKHS